jgi:starvation-inducible DNA-binding protein
MSYWQNYTTLNIKILDMKLNIGLKEKDATEIAKELNLLLTDEYTLYITTRHYHWNAEAPMFYMLHKMYEAEYEQTDEVLDTVAERIRAIGGYANIEFKNTSIVIAKDYKEQIEELLMQHENIIRHCRKLIPELTDKYNDAGTADFITGLMEQHEKTAWMLRAHL